MSNVEIRVAETVLAFSLVVLLSVLLKRHGIVHEEDRTLFSRLLTQAALPVVIFSQLSTHPVASRQLLLVLAMIVTGSICLVAAWAAGKLMNLDRSKIGALMITSAFGSSALIGYPLIQFAFPNDPEAMTDAILVSELGVGLPIFTLCPVVAMYFGGTSPSRSALRTTLLEYFRSPIFVAVVAGLLISRLPFSADDPLIAPIFEAFRMVEGALTVLACLVLGLQLRFTSVRGILPLVVVSASTRWDYNLLSLASRLVSITLATCSVRFWF